MNYIEFLEQLMRDKSLCNLLDVDQLYSKDSLQLQEALSKDQIAYGRYWQFKTNFIHE